MLEPELQGGTAPSTQLFDLVHRVDLLLHWALSG